MAEALYHIWYSTKGRKQALEGEVGEEMKRPLIEIAQRSGIPLLGVEVVADHAPPVSRGHRSANTSARFIFLKYPELKLDLGKNSFWQKGCGWRRISPAEVPIVRRYIRTQRTLLLRHQH